MRSIDEALKEVLRIQRERLVVERAQIPEGMRSRFLEAIDARLVAIETEIQPKATEALSASATAPRAVSKG